MSRAIWSARPDIVAEICAVPVETGRYDVVLMTQVLKHLEFPVKGLSEVCRVLDDDAIRPMEPGRSGSRRWSR